MTNQPLLGLDGELYGSAFGQLASPIHWPSLTVNERASRGEQLREWVEQLAVRFALDSRVVPPCWQRHNAMVEALSALRDHERASFADTAAPTAAVDWLRALREVEQFLREIAGKTQCTTQVHRTDIARTWTSIDPSPESVTTQPN